MIKVTMPRDAIKEEDHVVLMKNFDSQNVKIISVKPGVTIHYGKLHFDPAPIISSTFGSVFDISEGTMKKVDNFDSFNEDLSQEVSNKMGSNFVEKSQFSQEKIIKKKKKQSHSNIVTVIRPSLLLLNDMLYARNKICGLRSDLVAQILTSANVQDGAKVLLLDHNLGMLTSAVMSRILPNGVCVQLLPDHEAYQTTRKTMRLLNIRESDCVDNLFSITIRDFYKFHTKVDDFVVEDEIIATSRSPLALSCETFWFANCFSIRANQAQLRCYISRGAPVSLRRHCQVHCWRRFN